MGVFLYVVGVFSQGGILRSFSFEFDFFGFFVSFVFPPGFRVCIGLFFSSPLTGFDCCGGSSDVDLVGVGGE